MKTRSFGNDETQVSEIGLGAWQLGADWGEVSDAAAREILEKAVDSGVTFFDTADVYGQGRSENLIAKYLRPIAPKSFIATKLGRYPEPGGNSNYTLEIFRSHTEASLKRLGVDALDLTQLHCVPTEILEHGDVFEWLRRLRKEGKIQRFGASVESMEEARLCLQQEGLSSLQIIFNIFRQKPSAGLFDQAKAKGVALIIRLPLASGLLGGKLNGETMFPENDHRNYNRDGQCFNVGETFSGLPFEKGLECVEALRPLIPKNLTLAQMALRWILDFDAVTVIIPGAKSASQVAENISPSALPSLPESLHQNLSELYHQQVYPFIRGKY